MFLNGGHNFFGGITQGTAYKKHFIQGCVATSTRLQKCDRNGVLQNCIIISFEVSQYYEIDSGNMFELEPSITWSFTKYFKAVYNTNTTFV